MKMKKNIYLLLALVVLSLTGTLTACYSDEGNYDYLPEEEAGKITIDTIGIANRLALSQNMNPGDTIVFEPNVHYAHPERLRYRWFVLPMTRGTYQPVQNGNIMEYPAADTIACTKKLDWVVPASMQSSSSPAAIFSCTELQFWNRKV